MLNGHSDSDSNRAKQLDGLFSMNDLSEFDMGRYTMKLLTNADRIYRLKTDQAFRTMDAMVAYRREGLFCDVVLRVKDQREPAHKVVLASASTYFASMFGRCGHLESHTTQDIDLSKLIPCPLVLSIILDFLYTSQVKLNDKCVRRRAC